MDMLCEALKLNSFLPENRLVPEHSTSLIVGEKRVEATHDGWQVITAAYPLRLSRRSYFEAVVLSPGFAAPANLRTVSGFRRALPTPKLRLSFDYIGVFAFTFRIAASNRAYVV